MAQEAETQTEGETPEAPKDESNTAAQRSDDAPNFDKEYVSSLRSEAADWRIKAQQATERLEEYEEANKSELEKAQSKAAKADARAQEAEGKLLRFQVAAEKQVPKELISRLQGSTREELEADADELLTLVKSRTETDDKPDFDGGVREPGEPSDPAASHQNTVAKLFGLPQQL